MITNIINIIIFRLTVFCAVKNAANVSFTFRARTETGWIRQNGLQKLQWYNLMTLKVNRFNTRHTDIFKTAQMTKITFTERHKKSYTSNIRNIFDDRFHFLVMNEVHIFLTDLREVINSFNLHRFGLNPLAVLVVHTRSRDFTNVYFRIKICRKRITVVAAVAV